MEPRCVPHHFVAIVGYREIVNGAGVRNKHGEITGHSGRTTEPEVVGRGTLGPGVHPVQHVARVRVAWADVGVGGVAAVADVGGRALTGATPVTLQTRLLVGVLLLLAVLRTVIGISITLHTLLHVCVLWVRAVVGTGGTPPGVRVGTQRGVTGVRVLVLGQVTVGALGLALGPCVLIDR